MPLPRHIAPHEIVPDPSGRPDHVYCPRTDEAICDPESVALLQAKVPAGGIDDEGEYAGLTRAELIDLAELVPIDVPSRATKDEIIALLEEAKQQPE